MPITMSLVGQCLASRYQIDQHVGSDAGAELYFAHHVHFADHRFVVRVQRAELALDLDAKQAFLTAARRLNAARVSSRIAIVDVVELADSRSVMVFELREPDVTIDEVVAWYDTASPPIEQAAVGAAVAAVAAPVVADAVRTGPRTLRRLDAVESLVGHVVESRYEVREHIASDALSDYYTAGDSRFPRLRLVLRVLQLSHAHDLGISRAFGACAQVLTRMPHNPRIEVINFTSLPDSRAVIIASLLADDVTPREIYEWFTRAGDSLVGKVVDAASYIIEEPLGFAHEADIYLARSVDHPEARFALRVMRDGFVDNAAAETAFRAAAHAMCRLPEAQGTRFVAEELLPFPDGRLCLVFRLRANDVRAREIIEFARAHTPCAPAETRKTDRRYMIRELEPNESLQGQLIKEKFLVLEHVGSDPRGELYTARNQHDPNTRCVVRVMRLEDAHDVEKRKAFAAEDRALRLRHDHRIALGGYTQLRDMRLVTEFQLLTGDLDPDAVIEWYLNG